jgi:hypothetical protein
MSIKIAAPRNSVIIANLDIIKMRKRDLSFSSIDASITMRAYGLPFFSNALYIML